MTIINFSGTQPLKALKVLAGYLLLASTVAGAGTVYKVIDEYGHVTYTDTPPLHTDQQIEEIELPDVVATPPGENFLEQVTATADRLRDDRLAREAQRNQPPAETSSPATGYGYPQDIQQPTPYYWGYPYRPRPGHHRPHRPGQKPDRDKDTTERGDSQRGTSWQVPLRKPLVGPNPLEDRR